MSFNRQPEINPGCLNNDNNLTNFSSQQHSNVVEMKNDADEGKGEIA
jgi:hypothetical protein